MWVDKNCAWVNKVVVPESWTKDSDSHPAGKFCPVAG
jgi:hypothetical protein